MTKNKTTIYSIFLGLILLSLFFAIFNLISKTKDYSNNLTNKDKTIQPTPPEISEISWDEAVDLIQNCQIKTVFQKRNLEVTLTDKNNHLFKTKEPKFNDVFDQTNRLRSDCNDIIQTITE